MIQKIEIYVVSTQNLLMKPKEEAMNHSDGGDVDDLSDDPSSPESASFDDGDLLSGDCHDEVTAQLAAAGLSFITKTIKM